MDYDIIVEDVRPFGPAHIQVEFYAERQDDHTPLNATLAYEKLTEKGQDYYYPNSNFHFVKIQMKGEMLSGPVAQRVNILLVSFSVSFSLLWSWLM